MGPHPPQTQAWTQTASAQPGRPWLTGLGGGSCDGRRVPHALPQPVQHLARAAGKVEPALQPAGQKRGVGERKEGGGGEGNACLKKPCRSLSIQHLPRAAGRVSPACSQEQHQKGPSWHPLRESVGGARSLRRLQQLGQCAGAQQLQGATRHPFSWLPSFRPSHLLQGRLRHLGQRAVQRDGGRGRQHRVALEAPLQDVAGRVSHALQSLVMGLLTRAGCTGERLPLRC